MSAESTIDLSARQIEELERLATVAREGDHYRLLGVEPGADGKAIQQAYYELSRKWHPDRFFRKELGPYAEVLENVFIAIAEAYRVLGDDARRAVYDMQGNRRGVAPPPPMVREEPPVYEASLPRRARSTAPRSVGSSATRSAGSRDSTSRSASGSTTGSQPGSTPARPRRRRLPRSRGLRKVRAELIARLRRARRQYEEGKAAFEKGEVLKASAALALAVSFDPDNEEYARLHAEVRKEARRIQVQQAILAAENAETYRNVRAAMEQYRRAIEYEPDDGLPYYRLGMLVWKYDDDLRSAIPHLRRAAVLDPGRAEYRLALGDAYLALGMKLNARREFQAVLDVDKDNQAAREGLKKAR